MKFCPMCGTTQDNANTTVCKLCDYEEKPIEKTPKEEIDELMAPYEYEWIEDGARILRVRSSRDTSLRGKLAIPHFVTEIAADALSCCKFLARIDLPKKLRYIGDGAFAHCRDLFDLFIPESVEYIGKGAFAQCYDLGVIPAAAAEQPCGWASDWLADCDAKVEWSSTDEV